MHMSEGCSGGAEGKWHGKGSNREVHFAQVGLRLGDPLAMQFGRSRSHLRLFGECDPVLQAKQSCQIGGCSHMVAA